MAFTNNFRIERIYFEKLKSNIDILKSYIEAGATGEALELLKNSVDVNGAVLLLYRNLGEAWAELADLIQKTQKDLKDLDEKTEAYHDELNERIDEVNNYLMALIRELDARLQVVEQDLATMNRNKFYDLVENNESYLIEKDGETVSFDEIKADADFPHDVILRYDNGTSVTELEIREFTDSRIDFYSIGLADSDKTVKEILVSIDDTEAVTYSENTLENPLYTFGTGLSLDSNNELSVDFNSVQGKLTEGTGIDIDSNNEISVDTTVIQEKLTAGNNISITNNVISATDTTYSEGTGIDIDSNNVISADTTVLQEKLVAGSGISIDPDTNEISNTAQGSTYSAGDGILIDNDVINVYNKVFNGWNTINSLSLTGESVSVSNVYYVSKKFSVPATALTIPDAIKDSSDARFKVKLGKSINDQITGIPDEDIYVYYTATAKIYYQINGYDKEVFEFPISGCGRIIRYGSYEFNLMGEQKIIHRTDLPYYLKNKQLYYTMTCDIYFRNNDGNLTSAQFKNACESIFYQGSLDFSLGYPVTG